MKRIWMNMNNTTFSSIEDMINKLQNLKRTTKLIFYKILGNYYDEMNIKKFKFEQNPFTKNAEGINKV